ncbi:hypothetical protein LAZ29_08995 [Cereibacter sphaeroides]|uniref:hypothetical protein n=1 Tax=Rhodobacterales TaxID=204455 RepID=UPI000BBEF0AC|nr:MULTISPECIES: hypothetical protein [Paracoccaceae]MCE6951068.1 hypothetical protein [Cereibacter sphaeroides]
MSPFAIQALIIGVGVSIGLWLLWWRTGQMRGPRRLALALAGGGFSAVASLIISRTIASV